ncbi:flagellar basal body P-ring protein FlgI [Allosphingosinicella sp.]|jgi:flagellar P-ring protein precursor FlgI|uniref:flagellar basal body P-ring protein FlgI n=1 Tax=Allosphingosinicella sp. TaxID=2823234 RepID=UPI002EEE1591
MSRTANLFLAALLLALPSPAPAADVRVGDLGRFLGWRDNALVGYGIVTGLAGSGDSPRSEITRQALRNALSRLGMNVAPEQLQSRNVAAVMITATLPPSANVGDRIDVTVASIGDARSLAGGTLLMTPLLGPDQRSYALAQGSLVVGGHRFDSQLNSRQRNYPTSAVLPGGATVESSVRSDLLAGGRALTFILRDPDYTTAERIADGINQAIGQGTARATGRDSVTIDSAAAGGDVQRLLARIENVPVIPAQLARIVVNERLGTVVAGGSVRISSVVVSQGDIEVAITADQQASQPSHGGFRNDGIQSLVVTNTRLEVSATRDAVIELPSSTVGDLVQALNRARVDTRGIIAILQAIRAAGALHAEIIVQ